jgi:hypothetical protein
MNTRKDIESAFREAGQKLTVEPSSQAWQRLERRLDGQKKPGRVVLMRWVAAVAALFLLVFSFYLLNSPKGNDFALDAGPVPSFLEDLANTGDCQPYCLLLTARGELPHDYAYPTRPQ